MRTAGVGKWVIELHVPEAQNVRMTIDPYAKAAEKYFPKSKPFILFVAEAPPEAIDRYFYFEDVTSHDWLWIALMKALYPSEWGKTKIERQRKRDWLKKFQASGYQLIDAVKQPIGSALSDSQTLSLMKDAAPELIAEIRKIDPKQIVLIKATVHEAIFRKLIDAGLPVVNEIALPFPASGQQENFASGFRELINDEKLRLSSTAQKPIPPDTRVRYIKLGEAGKWEKECREKGIIRFGFGSAETERFGLCMAGRWEQLKESFIAEDKSAGTATRFTNETKIFFDDDGKTLWITFMKDSLYWGFLSPTRPERHVDNDGVWRTVAGGWKAVDLKGEPLTKDRLAGALIKIASYQGTSCNVDVSDYVIRRINGQTIPYVERAVSAMKGVKSSVVGLMRLLGDRDFEILVDLVFSSSGWRRQGVLGKTQKTLDLDLILPSTGERAFVQVKSKTTSKELAEYIRKFDELDFYERMFYVFHSGKAETKDDRVVVLSPDKLADLVIDAGLVNWLIRKVS